jgi:transcriptional regulator with GAF, ATPase, and Fis domain
VANRRRIRRYGWSGAKHGRPALDCLTNRDLSEMVAQGKFCDDPCHRLCVVPVRVPSLRERTTGIRPLAEYFLGEFCTRNIRPKTLDHGGAQAARN